MTESNPTESDSGEAFVRYFTKYEGNLPHDLRHGEWRPAANGLPGALQARPFLWREDSEKTLLLHVAGVDPSPNTDPPVRLTVGSRLCVRGRLDHSHTVFFGFATFHAGGGFAGKYGTSATVKPDHDGGNGFAIELPIEKSERNKEGFPPSPLGLELADFWTLAAIEDVGLESISVELLKWLRQPPVTSYWNATPYIGEPHCEMPVS